MSRAQEGSLAGRQGGFQVLAPADLDELAQGLRPEPQPHHVDRFAGGEPEPLPDQSLCVIRTEFVTEQQV